MKIIAIIAFTKCCIRGSGIGRIGGAGIRRSSRNVLPSNTKVLRAEDIAFGSMLHLIKKYPSPRFRVNPNIDVDVHTGKIILSEQARRTITKLDVMLEHKFEDDEILESEMVNEID